MRIGPDGELELRERTPGSPELSRWGAFGEEDELGALNFLTPPAVERGAACVQAGVAYPLNLPVDLPKDRPIGRPEFVKIAHLHNADFGGGMICNDDHVVLATQGSSQWDAFVHSGCRQDNVEGVFYNGFVPEDIDDLGYAHRGGIDKVAMRGIAGRGVLVDVARMVAGGASDPLPLDFIIDERMYRQCLQHQGCEIKSGDILCFRTGWTESYLDGDDDTRHRLMMPDGTGAMLSPGISTALAQAAHDERWAAITADNMAVEAVPILPTLPESAHITIQRNLGVPFGELLLFRDLSQACQSDRRWTFFFVAVPMWIPGGMGSPANAIGIR
jgi:hypothetical protein